VPRATTDGGAARTATARLRLCLFVRDGSETEARCCLGRADRPGRVRGRRWPLPELKKRLNTVARQHSV
jgi:hypothetical protein